MNLLDNPKHWRSRADEARRLVELSPDPMNKIQLMELVENYESLARRAERRVTSPLLRPPANAVAPGVF